MIKVIPFALSEHMGLLVWWLVQHKAHIAKAEEMPAIGFVAYYDGQPGAMAFLRRVEGGYGQLDGLVSNPESLGSHRSACIDAVVKEVINEAKAKGIKALMAYSIDKNTLVRSLSHGFVQQPHTLIALDLSEKV